MQRRNCGEIHVFHDFAKEPEIFCASTLAREPKTRVLSFARRNAR